MIDEDTARRIEAAGSGEDLGPFGSHLPDPA